MDENTVSAAVRDMIETNRIHKALIESRSSGLGICRSQHILLMHLAAREKCSSQKELAEHLGVTPAAVTESLKKLERDGFIERSLGEDNRFNEIRITQKGKNAVKTTKTIFRTVDYAVFDGFTDEDVSEFVRLIEKMKENLKKESEKNPII